MFGKLLLLFILIPLADMILLFLIANATNWLWTILIVILSGALGAYLASVQSKSVKDQIRNRLKNNQMPADLLTDGMMIFFAAVLLITPGIITDCFGLSLLIPASRRWYKRRAKNWLREHLQVQVFTPEKPPYDPNVVDGEVVEPAKEVEEPTDEVIDAQPPRIGS